MLFVFYGSDALAVRDAAFAKADALTTADPTLVVSRLEAENYLPGQLASLSETLSLFGTRQVYVLDLPSLVPAYFEEVLTQAEALAASTQIFIVIEGGLLAAAKKKFEAEAAELTEFKKVAGQTFDAFKMAEALARKDKRLLWILLQEARGEAMTAEEVVGILWWQLKTLALAARTASASEAGVKDYPYTKAKQALGQFKSGEVDSLMLSLLTLYHEGHAGKRDIDLALEEWVLRL
jgi:DNA polymerase III delta subunit